jgi:hypothetical protein
VWYPPVRIGTASYKVLMRSAQLMTAQSAINSLNGTYAQNWNAELYLRNKVIEINGFIAVESRLLEPYRVSDPEITSCVSH